MKSQLNQTKKISVLILIALTCLSATLLHSAAVSLKKEKSTVLPSETATVKKLKNFSAKNYLEEYQHRKKAKEMMNEATNRALKLK